MSWVRGGDTAGTHPALLAVREHPDHDDRLLNEVRGFLHGCAALASAHDQDYVVTRGTAIEVGGTSRAAALIEVALWAGLFTDTVPLDRGRVGYVLIDDPKFLHIRTKAAKEWEAQRKADSSNLALTVPVRLRDGDGCRYCGVVVTWGDTRSARGGTYDHRQPGQRGTLDTVVVSCRGCNAGRGTDLGADAAYPLMPVPAQPYYCGKTATWLTANGHPTSATTARPATQPDTAHTTTPRPGNQPGTAPPLPRPATQPATATARPATPADPAPRTTPRPDTQTDTAHRATRPRPAPAPTPRPEPNSATAPPPVPPEPAGAPTAGAGSAGSGRDRDGSGPGTTQTPRPVRARRRARRGRTTPPYPTGAPSP